jgi:hypothetical protein
MTGKVSPLERERDATNSGISPSVTYHKLIAATTQYEHLTFTSNIATNIQHTFLPTQPLLLYLLWHHLLPPTTTIYSYNTYLSTTGTSTNRSL